MHRIDSPSATADHMFTEGSPTGGIPATVVTDDWLNDVQENIMAVISAGGVTPAKGRISDLLNAIRGLGLSQFGAPIGARMSVPTTSASATFSVARLTVGSAAGGSSYTLQNLVNLPINLAASGLGGMDTGTVPASGYVAIYAMYNPTTGDTGLITVNATSAVAPEFYGGTNAPAGFTASALVSVWRVAASKFFAGIQMGRSISFVGIPAVSSSTPVAALTAFSAAAVVPMNAKSCGGFMAVAGINTTNASTNIASTDAGFGQAQVGGNSTTGGIQNISSGPFSGIKIITPQTLYWNSQATTGSFTNGVIYISSYDF